MKKNFFHILIYSTLLQTGYNIFENVMPRFIFIGPVLYSSLSGIVISYAYAIHKEH